MTNPAEQGTAALAPCPFCGTHPAVKAVARDWWKLVFNHTDKCMLSGHLDDVITPQDDESKAAPISMWNRRASLPSSEGAGWRDIASAPKDETPIILGYAPDGDDADYVGQGRWHEEDHDGPDNMGHDAGFMDDQFDFFRCARSFGNPDYQHEGVQPTHWMPLPPAPGAASAVVKESLSTGAVVEPGAPHSAMEAAARWVEARRDAYVNEHGNYDPDTGAMEFPGDGADYVVELDDIAEGLRALAPLPEPRADDLAALVSRLARSLRQAKPDHHLADQALDYLKRHGLQGSPLRADGVEPGAQAGRGAVRLSHVMADEVRHMLREAADLIESLPPSVAERLRVRQPFLDELRGGFGYISDAIDAARATQANGGS